MLMKDSPIPKPEHPRPDYQRAVWLNLNGAWAFDFCDEVGAPPSAADLHRTITVPFSWAAPLSGVGENRRGGAWYVCTADFAPPEGERVFLCIGAADYHTRVYVNGAYVGEHIGGYGAFSFDVSEAWHQGPNILQIHVTDTDEMSQTRGKQSYGEIRGLWQTVYLEARPATHIAALRLRPHSDGEMICQLDVTADAAADLPLLLSFGPKATRRATVSVREGRQTIETVLRIDDPLAWSPDNPHLYEGVVCLGADAVNTYFGYRTVGYRKMDGREHPWITLNNVPVYLNGTLDQSFHPTGYFTLPSEDDVRMEAQRLKDIGLNYVRIHIKPEEPRKLYWLSKLGVMVMQDMCCFWGEPTPEARSRWESECRETIERDFNHPCIIAWCVFNETWGLFTKQEGGMRLFTKDTQEWVRAMYRLAKDLDPSRLIEDNSACNNDHVESDLNSWHFYLNGYGRVRDEVRSRVLSAVPGSHANYIGDNLVQDVPFMNSECGLVWGVDGSAGDSDLAWQYRYMLNEFRKHDKMCGFVFTEFHDVVNEWNGYYRIDNEEKDFGYGAYVPGMTLRDLHAKDFIVIDAPPCRTVGAGETWRVPLFYSCFNPASRGKTLALHWTLTYEGPDGAHETSCGVVPVPVSSFGVAPLPPIDVTMPGEAALAVLGVSLLDAEETLTRNFITFDVRGPQPDTLAIRPCDGVAAGFDFDHALLQGHKRCLGGKGEISWNVDARFLRIAPHNAVELVFEAAARQTYSKDVNAAEPKQSEGDYMQGFRALSGKNRNTCYMTDTLLHPSAAEVLLDGALVAAIDLPDDPADARGALSWHYQETDRLLDDAGSYGYVFRIRLPQDAVAALAQKGGGRLTLRVPQAREGFGGLSLYGRNAGRYPFDILLRKV